MLGLLQPRLFLSYSHEDEESVLELDEELQRRGFRTLVDRERLLVGENFVEGLQRELSRADALVALLTPAYAASEWCQAELHHAHAKQLDVLPVCLPGESVVLPEPLRLLQEKLHTIGVGKAGEPAELGATLAEHLGRLRHRRRWRVLRAGLIAAFALGLLVAFAAWLVSSIERFQQGLARERQIRRIETTVQPIQEDDVTDAARVFKGDRNMQGRLLSIARDASQHQAARLSALLLASRIVSPSDPRDRWVIEDLNWREATMRDGRLTNVTFNRGSHSNLAFRGSTLSGVVWGESPGTDRGGLTLSNTVFDGVDFLACEFAGTSLVDVEFRNCSFRGSVLDLSSFTLVRMVAAASVPRGPNVITDEIASVENSVIVNRNEPPDPGVLDLGRPQDEVVFRGVVFDSVHFRGWMRPEWFEDCWFWRSVLPKALNREALEARGNRLDNVSWADEPID